MEAEFSDRYVDIAHERFDLVIRPTAAWSHVSRRRFTIRGHVASLIRTRRYAEFSVGHVVLRAHGRQSPRCETTLRWTCAQ
jgi:hypothetical protein